MDLVKVSLVIGGVEVTLSGVELTLRQVKELMRSAGSIALALPQEVTPPAEPERSHPIGFTAHLEIAEPDEITLWYDDEEQPLDRAPAHRTSPPGERGRTPL